LNESSDEKIKCGLPPLDCDKSIFTSPLCRACKSAAQEKMLEITDRLKRLLMQDKINTELEDDRGGENIINYGNEEDRNKEIIF